MNNSVQTRHLVVDGVRSSVLTGGPPETAGATEAVVFVHGNPGSGGDWEPLLIPTQVIVEPVRSATAPRSRISSLT